MHAGREILIGLSPGIDRQAVHISPGRPVRRNGIARGLADQGRQPLFGGGIAEVIQPVEIDGANDGGDIGLRTMTSARIDKITTTTINSSRENPESRRTAEGENM